MSVHACINVENHKAELVLAWWNHKVVHKWIIPSINCTFTKMPLNHWDLVPNNTNTMEGSHTDDNRIRGINHSLVDAIFVRIQRVVGLLQIKAKVHR